MVVCFANCDRPDESSIFELRARAKQMLITRAISYVSTRLSDIMCKRRVRLWPSQAKLREFAKLPALKFAPNLLKRNRTFLWGQRFFPPLSPGSVSAANKFQPFRSKLKTNVSRSQEKNRYFLSGHDFICIQHVWSKRKFGANFVEMSIIYW